MAIDTVGLSTLGLWSNTALWASGVPTVGENVLIPETTLDVDCTGMADLDMGTLEIARGNAMKIGESGNPVIGAWAKVIKRGLGKMWLNASASGTAKRVFIEQDSNSDAMHFDGTIDAGEGHGLFLSRGILTVADSPDPRLIRVTFVTSKLGDAVLVLEASSTVVTKIEQLGGECMSLRKITELDCQGGRFIQKIGQEIVTVKVSAGGYVDYRSNAAPTVVIIGPGGVADFTKNRTDSIVIPDVIVEKGGKFLRDESLVTVTNPHYFNNAA